MKKLYIAIFAILLFGALTACGSQEQATETTSDERPPVPAEYSGKTNPFDTDTAASETGETIFQTNCASCHGTKGQGDGPAAVSLTPKPQNLAENEENLGDDYLYWRISEGGLMDPFNSAMPAWKDILSEEKIWQIVTYIRTLDVAAQ
jgi:mono/diheme cytochrome c family protein